MGNLIRFAQDKIEKHLFKGKIIVLYGARQVGKTTLSKNILKKYPENSLYINCDEPDVRNALQERSSTEIKSFIGSKKLVVLDEAQRIKNIGLTLKLMIDTYPDMQIIATGSSSFELSNKIVEPLTGRKFEFLLYPFSLMEIYDGNDIELKRDLERRIVFGMYPEVVMKDGEQSVEALKEITKSYLYKDLFNFREVRNPEVLERLLQALALQIGNEVSYTELAGLLGIDKKTVMDYVQILEQAFIVFRLSPFSRNLRNELKKLRKIYFFDTGVRNALINNFNPLNLRTDAGALWENFMISERMKRNQYLNFDSNNYFWRTHDQQEIDYLEESSGKTTAFEFKLHSGNFKVPSAFKQAYPDAEVKLVNRDNFMDFVT